MHHIKPSDWLKHHPYDTFIDKYDGFFVGLAQKATEQLGLFEHVLSPAQRAELAVLFACWYEDEANGIGLWQKLREVNREILGVPVPFYDLDDYDDEDFNPQDIAYFLWLKVTEMLGKWVAPDSPAVVETAADLMELCDEYFLKTPEGNQRYFHRIALRPGMSYFDFKLSLRNFVLKNYLLGPHNHALLDELNGKNAFRTSSMNPKDMAYLLENELLLRNTAPFYGVSLFEWFLAVVPCPEKMATQIRGLHRSVVGRFEYCGRTPAKNYLFSHPLTQQTYEVHQQSVHLSSAIPGCLVIGMLVPWQGMYLISGIASVDLRTSVSEAQKVYLENQNLVDWYAWNDEIQQQIQTNLENAAILFEQLYGPNPVFASDEENMKVLLSEFFEYHKSADPSQPFKRRDVPLSALREGDGYALYIWPNRGIFTSMPMARLLWLLENKSQTDQWNMEVFQLLVFMDCVELRRTILSNNPGLLLHFPVHNTELEVSRYVEVIARVLHPEAYAPKYPMVAPS
ncbi:MAG: DUF3843 family protein [Saprospiraceae bacterium]|nr:DUF3843 family protein [Saprospiraceae bacterium]